VKDQIVRRQSRICREGLNVGRRTLKDSLNPAQGNAYTQISRPRRMVLTIQVSWRRSGAENAKVGISLMWLA